MRKTPGSIQIISAWLIFSGLVALLINMTNRSDPRVMEIMSRNPLPIWLQLAWVYLGALVSLISGIALLNGRNWARFLYLMWSGMTLVVSFLTSPVKLACVPGLIFFVVIAFFLFLPKAEAYFMRQG